MLDRLFPPSQDHLPLTWWKQRPIYLAALVALAALASMILTAILGPKLAGQMVFTYDSFFREWHLWTPLTCLWMNPPGLWTVIGCLLLWNFGEAVERHIGRRAFVRLLVLLWLAPLMVISLFGILGMPGFACAGVMAMEFAIFVAFATLYPTAKVSIIILTLDAWVLAAIFVSLNVLGSLFARDWASLVLLASTVGTAFLFIRYEKGELELPSMPKPASKPPKPAPKSSHTPKAGPSVDDLLDKISREGLHSLTAEERQALEKASREMRHRPR
jgi:hypothetical protein